MSILRIGFTCVLITSSAIGGIAQQEKQPSQREINIAPGILLRLPSSFTALPTRTKGLIEIVAQLPDEKRAYVKVTTEKRRSTDEAIRRLSDIALEAVGKRSFLEICSWPALQRQYRVRLAQVMAERTEKPLPEAPMVEAATIAIAQADTLVRFEATLQPGATAESTAPIFALVSNITCPANPDPASAKEAVRRLQQELLTKPSVINPPNPLLVVRKLSSTNAASGAEGSDATVQTSSGPAWSEVQVAASTDGKTVVVGSNAGTSFSNNYAESFATSSTPVFGGGDPTLATGASGRFYLGGINVTSAACLNPVAVNNAGNGATFSLAGNAAFCPMSGAICFPDQPQMAADSKNITATGDQLYVVWRNFPRPWWWLSDGLCSQITNGSPTPTISCSSGNGATWGHQTAVGSGDIGRITVGSDGFVYVTYVSGANVMLNKFSSCASGLNSQAGFPVTVASFAGIDCPISGLDRCDTSATASPQPAVSGDFPNSVFVAYTEKNGSGNDDVVVRHSRDGGLTWPDRVVANSTVQAHRYLPWVCAGSNGASVSWYDRRAATAADDSLTNYFFNTASSAGAGTESNVSVNADSQKKATMPCCPKYGDYNGNACTRDRTYVAWASATAPPGLTSPGSISVFVEAIPPGPPIITSVSPANAQCGSGTNIAIAGANFRNVSRVELQSWNLTIPLANFTVSSSTRIDAAVPGNLNGGVYEVVVSTPSGSSVQPIGTARKNLFSVLPTISSLNPSSGPATGGTRVAVSGSCFAQGSRFFFDTIEGTGTQCASNSQCTVYSPPSSVTRSVDVLANTAGARSTAIPTDLFSYAGPQITSVTPATGPVTGGTPVLIQGTGFPRYDGRVFSLHPLITVNFGSTSAIVNCDYTWCNAEAPPAANPGPVDVVATAFGVSSGLSPDTVFTYTTTPKLVRFDTPSTYSGILAVLGLNGYAGAGGASVSLSSADPSLINPPSTITIPAGQLAASTPVIVNPSPTAKGVVLTASYDGTSLTSTVNVPASPPLALSITATALNLGQSADVTVEINTPAPASGATVTLSSSSPTAISVPATVTIPQGRYLTTFSITNRYSGGPNVVTLSAAYSGASASESIIVFVPVSSCPARRCPPRYYWNPERCRCERTIIPH
jgi:hypothetical protein